MKKLLILLILALSWGCAIQPHEMTSDGAVVLYPDDFTSTAIQARIDEGCENGKAVVRLGVGNYVLTKAGPGKYNLRAAISWHCPGVSLEGDGIGSATLSLAGDMGHSASWPISLDPGASNGYLRGFTVDTAGTYNEDESSHAINIGSSICAGALCTTPVENWIVSDIEVIHPQPADNTRKGDCLHVFGNQAASRVNNVKFLGLNIAECARSGFAGQRFADNITIADSYFDGDKIGDTAVDWEATGGGGDNGFVFVGNTVAKSNTSAIFGPSNYALTLTTNDHFTITTNNFFGRGINLFRGVQGVIANNNIDATDMLNGVGVVDVGNDVQMLTITGNNIRRRGESGSLIKVRPASGHWATLLSINANTGLNETDGAAIFLDSAVGVTVSSNTLKGNHGSNSMGIYVTSGSHDVSAIALVGNSIDNVGYAGMRLDPTTNFRLSGIVVGANVVTNSGPGLRCDDTLLWPAGSLTRGLNNYSTPEICAVP